MTELTYFLLGFGFAFLVLIVLPIALIGTLSLVMSRAKRKNPGKLAELIVDMAKKGKRKRVRGGNEKGHTKENALAILENEETGVKKKTYSN